jgi:hypothetical protein
MAFLGSMIYSLTARITVFWAVVFALVHAYWAAGGAAGMNEPADTPGAQGYIAFIALLGLLGGAVAHGLLPGARGLIERRRLVLLARVGGGALLVGVVVGVSRWLVDGSLDGDGAVGVVTTVYFLLGGVMFSVLGWAEAQRLRSRPNQAREAAVEAA